MGRALHRKQSLSAMRERPWGAAVVRARDGSPVARGAYAVVNYLLFSLDSGLFWADAYAVEIADLQLATSAKGGYL